MPQYKALVFSIVGDITAEPAISSGFYSVQASAALRDSWKLGRTLHNHAMQQYNTGRMVRQNLELLFNIA